MHILQQPGAFSRLSNDSAVYAMEHSDRTWDWDHLNDYACVQGRLPVLEESIIQLDPGSFSAGASIVSDSGVTIYRARIDVRSIGVTVVEPAYAGFALPLWLGGDVTINAQVANTSSLFAPTADGIVYVSGARRATLGLILPRKTLIETLAALRGVGPDELILEDRPRGLGPACGASLRWRLLAILEANLGDGSQTASRESSRPFAEEVFGLLMDAYLGGMSGETRGRGGVGQAAVIVRRAEERFLDADGQRVSLADLCVAAGVGKSTLYRAFARTCGVPPLEYFHKRRLMWARSMLMAATAPSRGAVKRAALTAGLTELGRFSIEYQRLFGELPSATLNTSWT